LFFKLVETSKMGLTDALKQIMTDGEHFVISSGNTRKTAFVRLSKDNRTLIVKNPGCFLTKTKKIKIADIKEIQYGHQANHWKTVKDKMLPKKKFNMVTKQTIGKQLRTRCSLKRNSVFQL